MTAKSCAGTVQLSRRQRWAQSCARINWLGIDAVADGVGESPSNSAATTAPSRVPSFCDKSNAAGSYLHPRGEHGTQCGIPGKPRQRSNAPFNSCKLLRARSNRIRIATRTCAREEKGLYFANVSSATEYKKKPKTSKSTSAYTKI